jgi:hypothetical protein
LLLYTLMGVFCDLEGTSFHVVFLNQFLFFCSFFPLLSVEEKKFLKRWNLREHICFYFITGVLLFGGMLNVPKKLLMGQSMWLFYNNKKLWVHPWCESIMCRHLLGIFFPNNRVQNRNAFSSNDVNLTIGLYWIKVIRWASSCVLNSVIRQTTPQKMTSHDAVTSWVHSVGGILNVPKKLLIGQSIWLFYNNNKLWVHPWSDR